MDLTGPHKKLQFEPNTMPRVLMLIVCGGLLGSGVLSGPGNPVLIGSSGTLSSCLGAEVPTIPSAKGADKLVTSIPELIEQLASSEFILRQRAEQKLRKLGGTAIDDLVRVQYTGSSVEVRLAAKQLLSGLRIRWAEDAAPFVQRLEPNYYQMEDSERLQIVRWLASLEDGVGIVPVCRIARCEPDEAFSKLVVVSLLAYFDLDDIDHRQQLDRALQSPLLASQRPAVQWLRALQQTWKQPDEALKLWMTAVDAERQQTHTVQGSAEITESLILFVLERAIRSSDPAGQEASASLLAQLLPADATPEASELLRLSYLLLDRQQWTLFDQWIAQKFPPLVQADPRLAYCFAEGAEGLNPGPQGVAEGERRADAAFAIDRPPADDNQANGIDLLPYYRFQVAAQLERRGKTAWALREYERLASGSREVGGELQEIAYRRWAELLHDHERDQEAAEVLDKFLQSVPQEGRANVGLTNTVARLNFFRAEHYRAVADRDKQIDHLRQAIAADATDADVIIAMYRLVRADDEWIKETRELLQKAIQYFELQLREAGPVDLQDDESRSLRATSLNQLAWLISNTEGDYQAAIRYSHESLDLNPYSGGSLDTLGRSYFAIGDLPRALKYQRRATKLEPHSQQIRRQLEFFERAAKQPNDAK